MVAGLGCVKFKGEAGEKLRAPNSVLHSEEYYLYRFWKQWLKKYPFESSQSNFATLVNRYTE